MAAAASSFKAMSRAFRSETGAALCVTDSYRECAGQVAVFRSKPDLAATPDAATTAGVEQSTCAAGSSGSTPRPASG